MHVDVFDLEDLALLPLGFLNGLAERLISLDIGCAA